MTEFIRSFLISFGLSNELTDKERLNAIIQEQKLRNFLDDIKAIRTESYYIPDYNAAPKFAEYYIAGAEKWLPKTVVSRPVEFRNVEEWQAAVRNELKKISGFNQTNQLSLF